MKLKKLGGNSICLPEMSKVIDKELNEYVMMLGWGQDVPGLSLSIGYALFDDL